MSQPAPTQLFAININIIYSDKSAGQKHDAAIEQTPCKRNANKTTMGGINRMRSDHIHPGRVLPGFRNEDKLIDYVCVCCLCVYVWYMLRFSVQGEDASFVTV